MTKQKDLKRVVRTRMRKTGESYTAARVQVLARRGAGAKEPAPAALEPAPISTTTKPKRVTTAKAAGPAVDYAALAGYSDETIAAKTGCTWQKWVEHLDWFGAADKPHREIAQHVHEKFGVPGWWAQAVTVGYERIRGLRDVGQRRGGAYEASKSKTFPVPVERLFAAFAEPAMRRRWLPGVELAVRKATPGKSIRITWEDGTPVEVWLQSKGEGKSVAAIAHRKLPDRARVEELKRYWGERLDALAGQLAAGPA
jgi:uncharacterized protein YndB with AHSA1/START domain